MNTPKRSPSLRLAVQIAIWTLLLVVAFGPRHTLRVCKGGSCCASHECRATGCDGYGCCCEHEHAPEPNAGGSMGTATPQHHETRSCEDCCIDVSMPIEFGPLPEAVDAPVAELACVGGVEPFRLVERCGVDAGSWPFTTGPPRPERRTSLLVTTILRQ
ncbi:MAG TPA: hypothetical protein VFZ65_01900 [Planctomycetota bacterium]|nr:hypothetical protein [Planctomycetota bacterium]